LSIWRTAALKLYVTSVCCILYLFKIIFSETRIFTLGNDYNQTDVNGTVYFETPAYPTSSDDVINTLCHITSSESSITFYTLDIRLPNDTSVCDDYLTITDGSQTLDYDCSYTSAFNFTSTIFANDLNITFNSNSGNESYVWVGFKGKLANV